MYNLWPLNIYKLDHSDWPVSKFVENSIGL